MYCIKCGKKLDDWMLFCTGCGAKMPRVDELDEEITAFQISNPESEKEMKNESSEELYGADNDLYSPVEICKTCGKKMEEDEEFCTSCGQRRSTFRDLDLDQERSDIIVDPVTNSGLPVPPESDEQPADASFFCTKCGKKLEDWMLFCTGCGTAINPTNSSTEYKQVEEDAVFVVQQESDEIFEEEKIQKPQKNDLTEWESAAIAYLPINESVFCTQCGRELENWMEFCPVCALSMNETSKDLSHEEPNSRKEQRKAHQKEKNSPKEKKMTIGIIIGIIGAFVAVVIGLMVLFYNQCQLCEKQFFGQSYILIRNSQNGMECIDVCQDCYDTYGIDGSEESAESAIGVSTQNNTMMTDFSNTTTKSPQNSEGDNQISRLSDESVRLANVFLSNFSEIGIQNIDRNDEKAILDYAIKHDLANYDDFKVLSADEQFYAHVEALGNVKFIISVPGEIVQKKASRFFGTAPNNQATDSFYYANGQYYTATKPAESYSCFSNIYHYTDNGDGTVTFLYKVFSCKNVASNGFPSREVYKGVAETKENNSAYSYNYSAQAVLEKANIGKGYAPYRMISIHVI